MSRMLLEEYSPVENSNSETLTVILHNNHNNIVHSLNSLSVGQRSNRPNNTAAWAVARKT